MTQKTIKVGFIILTSMMLSTGYSQGFKHYNTRKNVAIGGFDLVSYFDHKPVKGEAKYAVVHQGITYLFSSADHKAAFKKSPKKYLPQYGGWCAYAMGVNGDKVKIDPETYKITEGKLYLFYNFYFNNTLDSWNEDEKTLKSKADMNWSKIIK